MATKGHDFLGNRILTKEEQKEWDRLNDLRNIEKTEALIKAGKYPGDALVEWRKEHPEPVEKKETPKVGAAVAEKDKK